MFFSRVSCHVIIDIALSFEFHRFYRDIMVCRKKTNKINVILVHKVKNNEIERTQTFCNVQTDGGSCTQINMYQNLPLNFYARQ